MINSHALLTMPKQMLAKVFSCASTECIVFTITVAPLATHTDKATHQSFTVFCDSRRAAIKQVRYFLEHHTDVLIRNDDPLYSSQPFVLIAVEPLSEPLSEPLAELAAKPAVKPSGESSGKTRPTLRVVK